MTDPTPTPVAPAPTPAPAPSVADKAATWVDNALAFLKVRYVSFLVGGGLGVVTPKLLSLLGL
jgi:hypothetical protein